MPDAWMLLRLLKYAGLALYGAGLWGALDGGRQRDRLVAAQWIAPLGWIAVWVAGYGMLRLSGRGFEAWVLQAMAATLVATTGALLAAARPRFTGLGAFMAGAGLVASIGVMVGRESSAWFLGLVLPSVFGLAVAWAVRARRPAVDDGLVHDAVVHWFTWIARLEGASLVLLVCVNMPLRKLTGLTLDGGTGTLGWLHGALVFSYLQALALAMLDAGWSVGRAALGFMASLVPFGTLVFEWRILRPEAGDRSG